MSGDNQRLLRFLVSESGDHVSGAIQPGLPAERRQAVPEPFRAWLFKESGSRNAAELELLLVDPCPFARKPALRPQQSRVFRQLRNVANVRCNAPTRGQDRLRLC